jgi:succinoglycan biosynthesis transport protein ExoP
MNDSDEPNIAQALGFLRRRSIWIALCLVLAVAAAYGYSKHQVKQYTATASLVFSSNQQTEAIAGVAATNTNALAQQASNLELVRLGDMAEETAGTLGRGLTAAAVSGDVSVSGQPESSIATVSATNTSPQLAADIANTYSQRFVQEQESASRRYYESALALVRKELRALSPQQRVGNDGLQLQDRAQSLELLAGLPHNTVQIAQEARTPTSPSSPRTGRDLLIGAILGLFVGFGLAVLLERLDPRIRRAGDLAAAYRVPLLGGVPQSAVLSRPPRAGEAGSRPDTLVEDEAFHMIRARLRSFNSERDIRAVLVTSAAPDEGKTTVARHLAAAAMRMGSRVLLLEADLRRPSLTQTLALRSQPGLTEVLQGTAGLAATTQSIVVDGQALDVLPAGPAIPRNPVELIESHAMNAVLAQARSTYDLVIVDSPELDVVSDAFLLLPKVDGVIIVGRVGHGRRDVAQRLRQVLATGGAPLVGVVANGIESSRRDSYSPTSKAPIASDPGAPITSANDAPAGDQLIPSSRV